MTTNISNQPAATNTPSPQSPRRLRAKDWINVGVYAVLYMVLVYAFGMLGYVPAIYPFCGLLYGLFCQIPVLLLVTKVRRFGALTLLGLLSGLVVGFGLPILIVSGLVAGLAADLVALIGRYRSTVWLIVSAGVLNLMWFGGSYLLFYLNPDSMMKQVAASYGQSYVDSVSALLPTWTAFAMPVGMFLAGCAGAWLALRVMHRHFERAGLI